jgi:hypothetical protein
MKLQPRLGKPLVEYLQHFLRILPILKTENEVIGEFESRGLRVSGLPATALTGLDSHQLDSIKRFP